MIYFSPSTLSFYDDRIHGPRQIEEIDQAALDAIVATTEAGDFDIPMRSVDNPDCMIPADAIEIEADRHAALMVELGDGKVVAVGKDGQPEAVEPEVDVEDALASIRRQRDRMLAESDWSQLPDALTAAKRKLWAAHRKALRDLPALVEEAIKAGKAHDSIKFPEPPAG